MKTELGKEKKQYEDGFDFDFKKEVVQIEEQKLNSILFKSFKKILFFFSGFSIVSLFFLMNKVSFLEQIEFIKQKNFSVSFLTFYCLYLFVIIIKETISTANDGKMLGKKFSSVWTPIQVVIYSSIFLPVNPNGTSVLTDSMIKTIELLSKFF